MSKETKPKRTRSTKSNTADLEAKIAELEARLANLSDQVQPSAKPAPKPAPKAEAKPAPRPAASGPTYGTLPAGMKPAPKPEPKSAPQPESTTYTAPQAGEVAPAYATISSSGYTGNRYFATRKRMSYHPADKQFTGSSTTTTTYSPPPPPPLAPEPQRQVSQSRGTLPAGSKEQEKKSMWRSKGAEYENYTPQEEKKTHPQHEHAAPPPPPKPAPRPAASGPTYGTLPAGMKPAPKPEPKSAPQPESTTYTAPQAGEVAPAYATISSSGYTGNRYFATRKRMSYHPADKQFTGSSTTTTAPPPEQPKPKATRGTLPAGFKP